MMQERLDGCRSTDVALDGAGTHRLKSSSVASTSSAVPGEEVVQVSNGPLLQNGVRHTPLGASCDIHRECCSKL
jgi:hypothetical protein